MSQKSVLPLKGFQDRYPEDIALQNYIFNTVREVAALYGFQEYDGPIVEPIELYIDKTNPELLNEQAFTLKDKNDRTLMLRPEMTPTLARMVAARYQELNLPVRLFNIGKRFRYEAPQKGRDREFYQVDFDILGVDSEIADIEILSVVVALYKKLGATPNDITVNINSRAVINSLLIDNGIEESKIKDIIYVIDRMEKISADEFTSMLADLGLSDAQISTIKKLLDDKDSYAKKFDSILTRAEEYGIRDYIQVNPAIVRGFDYYTGLVFEVTSSGKLTRSLLGGGRYNNLVGSFGIPDTIPGIGCAISDTVTIAFLQEANLIPDVKIYETQVLVCLFSKETTAASLKTAARLREAGQKVEMYPEYDKLPKQFKYANKKNIPFVVIIGPDEVANNTVTVKNMSTGQQETGSLDDILKIIS